MHEGRRFKRNRLLYEAFGGMLAKRRERPFPLTGDRLSGPSPEKQQNLERQGTRVTLKLKIGGYFIIIIFEKAHRLGSITALNDK